jgi:hypothetical protein
LGFSYDTSIPSDDKSAREWWSEGIPWVVVEGKELGVENRERP